MCAVVHTFLGISIMKQEISIYWANSMFSQADRVFNTNCVTKLRASGHNVFLPQENTVNHLNTPTASEIFRADTCALLESDILIACIDQETIDCGVSTEIGIAFASGIPIIGLCTDIRQYRQGEGRIYRNPYVIGTIQTKGKIVHNIDELLITIKEFSETYLHNQFINYSDDIATTHFDRFAPEYYSYIKKLESWYSPPWDKKTTLSQLSRLAVPNRVLDFGCGSCNTSSYISEIFPNAVYVGYDKSHSITKQNRAFSHKNKNIVFTSQWDDVLRIVEEKPFDIILVSFVLHDLKDPIITLNKMKPCLKHNGMIHLVDLTTYDLPRLTKLLLINLAKPFYNQDRRINPINLPSLAQATSCSITNCELYLPQVIFPTSKSIDEYLLNFGVYSGMDLPLGITNVDFEATRNVALQFLDCLTYPFIDQRVFISCTMRAVEPKKDL